MPIPALPITRLPITTHLLSEENILHGSILQSLQQQVIQNEIATIIEQILALVYEPLNPLEFVKQDAFLKGQLQTLTYLLDKSDGAAMELVRQATQQSRS